MKTKIFEIEGNDYLIIASWNKKEKKVYASYFYRSCHHPGMIKEFIGQYSAAAMYLDPLIEKVQLFCEEKGLQLYSY